jgi:cytoskeletal protein RodZ
MPALGERFRAAREARGLSLSDVSQQIRIRSVYLAAIEDENWASIGAPVYIRGFLRTYARFLGLDPEEVVGSFNGVPPPPPGARASAATPDPAVAPAFSLPTLPAGSPETPRRRGSLVIWAAGIVAFLLIAFVVYNEWVFHQQSVPSVAAGVSASPLPSTEATAPDATGAGPESSESPGPNLSPEVADGPNTLALTLTAPSWLRVTVDGSVSMEGTFPAGTSKTFHGKSALVRIGNAGGVEIRVDGKDVGKLGNAGDVIERSFTL